MTHYPYKKPSCGRCGDCLECELQDMRVSINVRRAAARLRAAVRSRSDVRALGLDTRGGLPRPAHADRGPERRSVQGNA